MKYLIIEDEKAAARNLKAMLEQLAPDMELIDVLDSVADTIDWFGCHAMPELVFMDIHLARYSSIRISPAPSSSLLPMTNTPFGLSK